MNASYLKHVARTVAVPVLHESGVLDAARGLGARNRRVALNYHEIDAATFSDHLAYLEQAFDLVDSATFLARGAAPARRKPIATLTFDDGYGTFADEIAPLLARHRVPALWFVATSLVDSTHPFWFDRVRLAALHTPASEIRIDGKRFAIGPWNRETVAASLTRLVKLAAEHRKESLTAEIMAALGEPPAAAIARFRIVSSKSLAALDPIITVGSHTHTHPQMSQLSDDALKYELDHSRTLLEKWTSKPVHHFAFPSGDYDARVMDATRNAGYRYAWTTEARYSSANDEPHRLPRVSVAGSVAMLSAKIAFAQAEARTMDMTSSQNNDRKSTVRDHFDAYAANNRWGELYNPANPQSHSFLARRTKAVAMLGSLRGKLLDIGCGTGSLLDAIKDSNVEYFGADNAGAMLEQAKQHAAEMGLSKKCTFDQVDAQALPYADNTFDSIVGLGLIEYFDEPKKVVSEALRVAKPGARLVFNIPLRYSVDRLAVLSAAPIRAVARKIAGKPRDIAHEMYTKAEFRELFEQFGAKVVEERVYNHQLLIYPFGRFFPEAARRAAAMVEDREGLDMFASGYLLACEKPQG